MCCERGYVRYVRFECVLGVTLDLLPCFFFKKSYKLQNLNPAAKSFISKKITGPSQAPRSIKGVACDFAPPTKLPQQHLMALSKTEFPSQLFS